MTDIKLGLQVDDKGSLKRAQAGMKSLSTSATQVDGKAKTMTNQMSTMGTQLRGAAAAMGITAGLAGAFAGAMKLSAEYSKEIERRLTNAQQSAFAKVSLQALSDSGGMEKGAAQTVSSFKRKLDAGGMGLGVSEQELDQAALVLGPLAQQRGVKLADALAVTMEAWAREEFKGRVSDIANKMAMVLRTGTGRLKGYALDPNDIRQEELRLGRTMNEDERAKFSWGTIYQQSKNSTLEGLLVSKDPSVRMGLARISRETAVSEQEDTRGAEMASYERFRQKKISENYVDPGNFWQSLLNLQMGDYLNAQTLNPASTIAGDWARRYKGSRSWRNIIRGLSPIMLAASAFTDGSSAQMPTVASPTQIQINIFPKGGE